MVKCRTLYVLGAVTLVSGDSGSPLMKKTNEDIWTLIAIVRGYHYYDDHLKDSDYQTIFPRLSWVLKVVNHGLI